MGISPEKTFAGLFSHPSKFQSQASRVFNLNQLHDIAREQEEQRRSNIVPPVPAPPASLACGAMTSIPGHARDANAITSEDFHIRESYIADQRQESTQTAERRNAAAAIVEQVRSLEPNNEAWVAKTYTRKKIVDLFKRFLNENEGQNLDDALKEKRRRLEEICEDFDKLIQSGEHHQLGIEKRGILCIDLRENDRSKKSDFYLKKDFLTLRNWEDHQHRVDKSFDLRSYRRLEGKLKEEFRQQPDSSEIQAPKENARAQDSQKIIEKTSSSSSSGLVAPTSIPGEATTSMAGHGRDVESHPPGKAPDADKICASAKPPQRLADTEKNYFQNRFRIRMAKTYESFRAKNNEVEFPVLDSDASRARDSKLGELSHRSKSNKNSDGDRVQGTETVRIQGQCRDTKALHGTPNNRNPMAYPEPNYCDRRNDDEDVQGFEQPAEADHVQHLFPLSISDGSHKRKKENSSAPHVDLTLKRPKSNNHADADNRAEQKTQITPEQVTGFYSNEGRSLQNHRYELLKKAQEAVIDLKGNQKYIEKELKQDRLFVTILEDRINHWYNPTALDARRESGLYLRSCVLQKIRQNEAYLSGMEEEVTGLQAICEEIRRPKDGRVSLNF